MSLPDWKTAIVVAALVLLGVIEASATSIRGSSQNGQDASASVVSPAALTPDGNFMQEVYCATGTDQKKSSDSSVCKDANYGFLFQFVTNPTGSVSLQFQDLNFYPLMGNTGGLGNGLDYGFEYCNLEDPPGSGNISQNSPTRCTNLGSPLDSKLLNTLNTLLGNTTSVFNGTTLTLNIPAAPPGTDFTVALYENQCPTGTNFTGGCTTSNVAFERPTLTVSPTVPEAGFSVSLLAELFFLSGCFYFCRRNRHWQL